MREDRIVQLDVGANEVDAERMLFLELTDLVVFRPICLQVRNVKQSKRQSGLFQCPEVAAGGGADAAFRSQVSAEIHTARRQRLRAAQWPRRGRMIRLWGGFTDHRF